jgi:arylsulfatase A-like enzyme
VVIWDTVRRDRMSVYGHANRTTPFVEEWSRGARVYENCVSAGSTTVPAHASIFTGLLPYQHGADNQRPRLSDDFSTLAELLKAAGYATYAFTANPHVSADTNLTQGFDLTEHPWSPRFIDDAVRITREKIPPEDESTELAEKIRSDARLVEWNVKTAGGLAQRGVFDWLQSRTDGRPYFVLLNYMEAHRPLIPPRSYRERFMSDEQVARSYKVDRRWVPMWAYTFGLREYTPEEVELTALTYDAALAELDDLFRDLLEALRGAGRLDNTVVVLLSDHGEHLGDHHMFDHQFSVYNELLYVPLIVSAPGRLPVGREARPVMNMDLFPTLLEIAGAKPPPGLPTLAVSLLAPQEARARVAEYPAPEVAASRRVVAEYPDFDPRPWQRALRAYYHEPHKLIVASDQRHELYDLANDPREQRNLLHAEPETARRLHEEFEQLIESLDRGKSGDGPLSPEYLRRLEGLGYAGGTDDAGAAETRPASGPASSPSRRP